MTIPLPRSIERADGPCRLDEHTTIAAPSELTPVAVWLQDRLRPATGLRLPLVATDATLALSIDEGLGRECYRLAADADGIRIVGGDRAGVFYGAQTLLQLLPPQIHRRARVDTVDWVVPATRIEDAPRFGWRGVMIDVVRHFLPKYELMRYIELLALHKINLLHLHLTDDQGWRLQIHRYPRLTEVGGWRTASQIGAQEGGPVDGRPHGGYYTQDDIREIVAFAADRAVQVMPEIEMPGHVQAAIAAYPELGVSGEPLEVGTAWGIIPHVLNTEESTVDFFRAVLDEVAALFPCPFIDVGGDECPTEQWQADPRSQELMRARGLTQEHELQAWFMARIGEHLASLGKRMVGWDELLEGPTPPSTVVASWRGMTGVTAAARRGHDVVACPDDHVYLDYRESERDDEPIPVGPPLPLRRVYEFEPIPDDLTPEEAGHVLGGQANLWTEHMDSPRVLDFHAFPRLCAVAEVLWTSGPRDVNDFEARLATHLQRLDALGVEYRAPDGPHPWQLRPGVPGRPVTLAERHRQTEEMVAAIRS